MPIEYETFSQFLTTLETLVAPEDVAENMEAYFRDQVSAALADIQTFIPWVRGFNVNVYTKDEVVEFCAASIFDGPVGKITQLFAYKPGRDCKKLYYNKVTTSKMDCWVEAQRCVQCTFEPPPVNVYDHPYCNYVLDGETACASPYLSGEEDDCRFLSLEHSDRIFAVGPDYKVYVAPRFPCQYYLLLQWQGIRRKWLDSDLVPVDQQLREAVMNRVEYRIAMKEREFVTAREYLNEYSVSLRVLKYRYMDEQDPELVRDCSSAIEQLMSLSSPLYQTPLYSPAYTTPYVPAYENPDALLDSGGALLDGEGGLLGI